MLYGPLFKKYMKLSGRGGMSANRLSKLTPEEIVEMSHVLYTRYPKQMEDYYKKDINELTSLVYDVLRKIDL